MPPLKDALIVAAAAVIGFTTTAYAAGTTRVFTLAAIEPKGGANVEKEPFPTAALPEGGGLS